MYVEGKNAVTYSEKTKDGKINWEVVEVDNGYISCKEVHKYTKERPDWDPNPERTITIHEKNPLEGKKTKGKDEVDDESFMDAVKSITKLVK